MEEVPSYFVGEITDLGNKLVVVLSTFWGLLEPNKNFYRSYEEVTGVNRLYLVSFDSCYEFNNLR